jgi:transposase
MTKITIGIDISKANLDVACFCVGEPRQFSNDDKGHKAFLKWLSQFDVTLIVFEPTGPYHRRLERLLADADLPYAKINPRQARRFAEATGKLAKTDRVDAIMLARFGALLTPTQSTIKSQELEDLAELHVARRGLMKDRTVTMNRQHSLVSPFLKRQATQRLKQIEAHITAIDERCRNLVKADPQLRQRRDILLTIPGIGKLTALILLIEMPELGTMDKRQAAVLAGLAPMTRQSGTWKGKSFIRGGRANLRQALYMPALVASRFNQDLRQKYQAMIAAGKPAKVAITAIMRRLITIANALLRDQRKWTENVAC